jgi:hypothetical protein
MHRYADVLRNYRSHSISRRLLLLSSTSLLSSPSPIISTTTQGRISSVPSLSHLPSVITSSIMECFYLNEMVSVSLTSIIIRQNIVRKHIAITRLVCCSSITRQSISLLKWCRSLHYLYFYLPWHKEYGFQFGDIQEESTNEVLASFAFRLFAFHCHDRNDDMMCWSVIDGPNDQKESSNIARYYSISK